ncbi:MAG: hypothetical protein ACE5JM_05620 [Armatimonadota bacterium]
MELSCGQQAWLVLLGAGAARMGSVVTATLGYWLGARRERERWEREQRQEALLRRVEDVREWRAASSRLEALVNLLAFELAGLDSPRIFGAFAQFIEPIQRDVALLPLDHHTAVMKRLSEYISTDYAEEARVSLGDAITKSLVAASLALDQATKERDAALGNE